MEQTTEFQIDNIERLRHMNGYENEETNLEQYTRYKMTYYEVIDFLRRDKIWVYVVMDHNRNQMSVRLDQPFQVILQELRSIANDKKRLTSTCDNRPCINVAKLKCQHCSQQLCGKCYDSGIVNLEFVCPICSYRPTHTLSIYRKNSVSFNYDYERYKDLCKDYREETEDIIMRHSNLLQVTEEFYIETKKTLWKTHNDNLNSTRRKSMIRMCDDAMSNVFTFLEPDKPESKKSYKGFKREQQEILMDRLLQEGCLVHDEDINELTRYLRRREGDYSDDESEED